VPEPVGLIIHATELFDAFVSVAVNCCVRPLVISTEVGETLTPMGGDRVTVAYPLFFRPLD